MTLRIGIDVGGTFTDAVAVDEETGQLAVWKHRTTYDHLPDGVSAALSEAVEDRPIVSGLFHGTTLVSNAIVQRAGAATGVIATRGFRDLLEIRRNLRQHLYDIYWDKPPALVRRMLRREVDERIGSAGEVIRPLDEESVREAINFLRHKGVTSYAVSLLFSFRNPAHELRIREIIEEEHPGADVSLSSDVAPEIREYERTSTVTLNAMVKPLIRNYLDELEDDLRSAGIAAPLYIMKGNGGVARPATIRQRAVETFESGPAAGVTAAMALGSKLNERDLITFDMGGTTTDVALVQDGKPILTLDSEVEWSLPVRIPMIAIRSVGAGGGSIAWVDKGGALRVGPRSAGSMPGPVAYGWGGEEPTVTDANLVLGRLPSELLGGGMVVDIPAAREAYEADIAQHFGWTAEEAAEATSRIALANMVELVREMTIEEGFDPRDFTLVAFGGNGPLYAADVATELEINQIIVPQNASVFSALGCLFADIRHEYVRTMLQAAEPLSTGLVMDLSDAYFEMKRSAADDLVQDGVAAKPVFVPEVELRYFGEAYEIRLTLSDAEAISAETIGSAVDAFHEEHRRLYGFRRDDPVELVNARLAALVTLSKPPWTTVESGGTVAPPLADRQVFENGGFHTLAVAERESLRPGHRVDGPAIIQEARATTVVPAGWWVTADEIGNLRLEVTEVINA